MSHRSLLRRPADWWRYKPSSGVLRRWFHFVPWSVVMFVVTICTALYIEAAISFIFDQNIISHVTIYDQLDPPVRQALGIVMLLILINVHRNPPQIGFIVVLFSCGLRGYDSIHLHSVAALTIYIPFLIVLPPLFQAMRGR